MVMLKLFCLQVSVGRARVSAVSAQLSARSGRSPEVRLLPRRPLHPRRLHHEQRQQVPDTRLGGNHLHWFILGRGVLSRGRLEIGKEAYGQQDKG